MTVLTFTTVGYEEVHPLSSAGRTFNLFMMVAGVGVMLYILTSLVNMVVAHEIVGALVRRHRMRTRMGRLRGHFIVCGYGRVGRAVALTLHEKGQSLIVLDKDPAALAEAEGVRPAVPGGRPHQGRRPDVRSRRRGGGARRGGGRTTARTSTSSWRRAA